MLWEIVEGITGIDRDHIKNMAKQRAAQFIETIICECGHPKWVHIRQQGKCDKCACENFVSRGMR